MASLPPGSYRIEAELAGFDRLIRGPVVLQVSQTLAIDLTLEVGQLGETVNVTEAAPLIESQSSDIGQAVPGLTYGAADFGVVTSARPGGTVQLAARLVF